MKTALLVVDVFSDFAHLDGKALLERFVRAHPSLVRALSAARASDTPIIYANDNAGVWDGDRDALISRARRGPAGDLVERLMPSASDCFLLKARYSAFDHTPLRLILEELKIERLLVCGTTTEMCVAQSVIDAREIGLKVTLLRDACAPIDERDETVAIDYLTNITRARTANVADIDWSVAAEA